MTRWVLIAALLLASCGAEQADSGVDFGADDDGGSNDAGATSDARAVNDVGSGSDSGTGGMMDVGQSDVGADASTSGLPDGPSSERLTGVVLNERGNPNGYYEYLPPGYGDGEARPLLVFWHGIGENGDGNGDLQKVLSNGPPRLQNRDEWPSERDFIVLSPQNPGSGCPGAASIDAFLTWAQVEYGDAVDTSRIYLTGLSCGAIGSWNYLSNYTDGPIAAAVLIAGDGRGAWNRAGCDLGNFAIWGFHGDADNVVPPEGTNVPIDNLIAECPNRLEAKKTIYPGVSHNSWGQTYSLAAGHEIYSWLLGFTKPQ